MLQSEYGEICSGIDSGRTVKGLLRTGFCTFARITVPFRIDADKNLKAIEILVRLSASFTVIGYG